MFGFVILYNSFLVYLCSVVFLLEIIKYINMYGYKYIRGYCGYVYLYLN